MSSERWDALSEWHNLWLAADPDERKRLRLQLGAQQPDLLAEADALAEESAGIRGFLETPAFLLAARELARGAPALAPDDRVGPYRIVGLLARGGMGDVYRATDIRLERSVAVKVLAHADANDPPRVERFLQEARITASLDHPNVVRLYDVGLFDGRPYLVTELLDGETLRARIGCGPLPPDEVRRIAQEVASGLAAAHAIGLVHRDLKPENLFLTRSGQTKILDFGIAKLVETGLSQAGPSTLTGVLLGTAGYLAPEQVKGEPVDARADLFALGSILFEMLTGRRAFAREHTIDTLHAIVHDAPPDILRERTDLAPALITIVMRLLEKSPADRFQTAVDLGWAIGHSAGHSADVPSRQDPAVVKTGRRWPLWAAAAAALAMLAFVGWRLGAGRSGSDDHGPTRFTWSLPAGLTLDSPPVISPDGRRIVFAGVDATGGRLYLKRLDSLDAPAITGSEGGKAPFWSPDGSSVGFFARGKLQRIAVAGGPPIVICDAPTGQGGTWSPSGVIVFGTELTEAGLARVSADGGPVEPATLLDLSQGENSHRWPAFLPDGIRFLYFVRSSIDERRGVYIGRIDRPATLSGSPLMRSESEAMFAPVASARDPGALFVVANGRTEARRFDATRLTLVGDAQTTDIVAGGNTPHHAASLSVSADTIAFAASPVPYGGPLISIGRRGDNLEASQDVEIQNWPRLSPDGGRLALQRLDPLRGNGDIWVEDLARHTRIRVTTAPDRDVLPVWSPDGRQIAYLAAWFEKRQLTVAAADGTGIVRVLPCPARHCEPTDWSRDGTRLLVTVLGEHGADVWMLPLDAAQPPTPLLTEAFAERDARFSRDGRWVAYVSDESGRAEVSVRSLSGPPRRFVISGDGGDQPVWRQDGRELFFVDAKGRLRSASVHPTADGGLTFGESTALDVPPIGSGHWSTQYDVSPDGERVYLLQAERPSRREEIGVITGWRALVR